MEARSSRTIDKLRQDGVKFQSRTEHFDSETAHGRFALQMHVAMAEYILDLYREHTMEGLKAALARGSKGGRPPKLSADDIEAARALLVAGTIPVADIANAWGSAARRSMIISPGSRTRWKVA